MDQPIYIAISEAMLLVWLENFGVAQKVSCSSVCLQKVVRPESVWSIANMNTHTNILYKGPPRFTHAKQIQMEIQANTHRF